ncbi:MAG: hypothetical protein IPJ19_15885 [Planctomycetes bacterium]|nr:hypothetical protein [Planctomycetota bacterium]
MAEWPLQALGHPPGGLELAAILVPLLLALILARLARKPASVAEFDGRAGELSPWSVGFSLAASDLSLSAALLALPLAASGPLGGLVCLQGLLVGGLIGRALAARWLLPALFEHRARGPLGAIEARLGSGALRLCTALFTGGALLATAGRAFLLVFALHVSLGSLFPAEGSLGGWSGFALLALAVWGIAALLAGLRGLRGSVAGDGLLFAVLCAAAVAGLVGLVAQLEGGWDTYLRVLHGSHKHELVGFATSPALEHTFWTALLVSSLASAAHYGADPLQQARLLATGTLARARKALWISLVSALPATGLCLTGAGLFAWKERNGLSAAADALVRARPEARWVVFVAEQLTPWARALVLAAFAISAVVAAKTLLAALLQLSATQRARRGGAPSSLRRLQLGLGIAALGTFGLQLALGPWISARPGALEGLQACGEGALGLVFAALALSVLRRTPPVNGLYWATPLLIVAVYALATRGPTAVLAVDVFAPLYFLAWAGWRFLVDWFGYRRRAGALVELAAVAAALALLAWGVRWGLVPIERHFRFDPEWVWLPLSSPWYVPTGGWIGFVFGCLLARGSAGSEGFAQTDAR